MSQHEKSIIKKKRKKIQKYEKLDQNPYINKSET